MRLMNETGKMIISENKLLKRGYTTGACATAATKSAISALIKGEFIDPVTIVLPKGQRPSFDLAQQTMGNGWAKAGIIKDAGDDPDVTHGALILAKISHAKPKSGISFSAGNGVGIVTKAGLPIKVGEAAINPVPRQMMENVINDFCAQENIKADFNIEISVANGEEIAKQTLNSRLGILGGISILGTSGIVIPYSCSAWISSIHSGIEVALANENNHIVASTGDLSEKAAKSLLKLPDEAYIEMGDFVAGLLKYARKKTFKKITIAGGFAKITKLSQGAIDLHSKRSQVDFDSLASEIKDLGASDELVKQAKIANSANQVLEFCQIAKIPLANSIAIKAHITAKKTLKNNNIVLEVLIINRKGEIIANSGGS